MGNSFFIGFTVFLILFSALTFAQVPLVDNDLSPTSSPQYLSGPVLWRRIGFDIYNANPGNVGIGVQVATQKLEVNGGVRLNTNDSKPVCDENARGTLWFTRGNPVDTLELCKSYDFNYNNAVAVQSFLQSPRGHLSCVRDSSNYKIYCFGGVTSGLNYISQIVQYDPITNSTSIKSATLPDGKSALSCVENSATHKIYCFGGEDTDEFYNQITEYDPNSDTLIIKSAVLPLNTARISCVENSATHKIYCFGGEAGGVGAFTNQILEYDPSTNILAPKSAVLPSPRSALSCVENSATHKIYCLGGISTNSNHINQIIEYDSASDVLVPYPSLLPTSLYGLSCSEISFFNTIFCFGGHYSGGITSGIVSFTSAGTNQSTLSLPTPAFGLSCVNSDLYIYCFGGENTPNYVNTILQFNPSVTGNAYAWIPVA